jgi:hypothetical protein
MMKTSRAMFGIKFRIRYHHGRLPRSALALVLLPVVLLAASTLNRAQATTPGSISTTSATLGVRQFYLTRTLHNGAQAQTACAEGYHMASVWEMADPSALEYNTTLGQGSSDSGAGPPTAFGRSLPPLPAHGWVRTGFDDSTDGIEGLASCDAWSSDNGAHWGTVANLPSSWGSGTEDVGVWNAEVRACDWIVRVWCVEDDGVQRVFLPLVLR